MSTRDQNARDRIVDAMLALFKAEMQLPASDNREAIYRVRVELGKLKERFNPAP